MDVHKRKRATLADLDALPEDVDGELIDGELFVFPKASAYHGFVQMQLGGMLAAYNQRPGPAGWWILAEPALLLGENVVAPDLAGWRRERVPVLPNVTRWEVVPDWVCEIRSPSTARHDRVRKLPLYLRAGVRHVWIVDPEGRLLEALEATPRGWLELGAWSDDDEARIPPFDDVLLAVERVLPPRPPGLVHEAS